MIINRSFSMIMVMCKNCGYEHSSSANIDKQSSEKTTVTTYSETCPRCDATSNYHEEDFFFRWYHVLKKFSNFQWFCGTNHYGYYSDHELNQQILQL